MRIIVGKTRELASLGSGHVSLWAEHGKSTGELKSGSSSHNVQTSEGLPLYATCHLCVCIGCIRT